MLFALLLTIAKQSIAKQVVLFHKVCYTRFVNKKSHQRVQALGSSQMLENLTCLTCISGANTYHLR